MQVEWRGASSADLDAWVEALAEIEGVDRTGEVVGRADLEEQLGLSYFDPALDARLGWSDGRIVAWGTVLCIPNDRQWRVNLAGAVVPAARGAGVGTALVGWQVARGNVVAERRHPSLPGWLELSASDGDTERSDLFRAFGFSPLRYYPEMRRRLDGDLPEPTLDPALVLARFDPAHDEATRRMHNEAFRDHFAATELDVETWRTWITGDHRFRGDLSFVVLDGDEVVGYALSFVYPEEWDALGFREGWTHHIGVKRAWRGRGIAKALLAATARAFRAEGLEVATLQVDAENPTGAFALYEHQGYVRGKTRVSWWRQLP
jgi:ribosomal protein S18 acetylase RimI-like enzyme